MPTATESLRAQAHLGLSCGIVARRVLPPLPWYKLFRMDNHTFLYIGCADVHRRAPTGGEGMSHEVLFCEKESTHSCYVFSANELTE